MEIIPSPLFPPKLMPMLVQVIVRCRHMECKCPFMISEKYIKMVMNQKFSNLAIRKLVQLQMKYLINSNENRLPRLTKFYKIYFDELDRIQQQSVYNTRFLSTHYNLYLKLKDLWTASEISHYWDLVPDQLNQLEECFMASVLSSAKYFESELNKRISPLAAIFSASDLYTFLFK